jgi:protein-tyrosine phosphatase
MPEVLVFVCLGNICRSPFAEQVARRRGLALGLGLPVGSGGFLGPDRPSPDVAREAARAAGYDLGEHRSRLVAEWREAPGAVFVVMEPGQATRLAQFLPVGPDRIVVLGDLDPVPIATRSIPDPYGRSLEEFATCYARIERCVGELIGSLTLPA